MPSQVSESFAHLTYFNKLRDEFNVSLSTMRSLIDDFGKELRSGLEGKPSSFAMLPSYVHKLPTAKVEGDYYGLDFGGTNFRATHFRFDGKGNAKVVSENKVKIPQNVRKHSKAEDLFDFFVNVFEEIDTPDDIPKHIGFTFSFPVKQTAVNFGELMAWTKGFEVSGVVGKNVVELLQEALHRRGKKREDYQIQVLVNDTVGTLATGKFERDNCVVGLILGTGTNSAYIEKSKNILKLDTRDKTENMMINVEWGAFGDLNRNLPYTNIDLELDDHSSNKHEQGFEKMISGYYLGEMVRRIILFLEEKQEIFTNNVTYNDKFKKIHGIDSAYVSYLDKNHSETVLQQHFAKFQHEYELHNMSDIDKRLISEICTFVAERAGKLTAVGLTGLLKQVDKSHYGNDIPGVGIDGSLFEHNPTFKNQLKQSLHALDTKCELYMSKDGSGLGAALLASVMEDSS